MVRPTLQRNFRLSIPEYGSRPDAISAAATATGMSGEDVELLLRRLGERTRVLLGLAGAPIAVSADGVVDVAGIAGLLEVAPGLELEIVPKFLDPLRSTWREDFFALATLSRFGHILPQDSVDASVAASESLPGLLARAMVHMYWRNHRRPLRTYERRELRGFALVGESNPLDLALPHPEGFLQRQLSLSRDNPLNSTIAGAVVALLPRVRDAAIQRDLQRVLSALGPQPRIPRVIRRQRLPSRHSRWQALHDLSVQVLQGYGGGYTASGVIAPGFVMDTWRAWENLVSTGARLGLAGYAVTTQASARLGDRDGKALNVRPDITATGPQLLLADAKYIGRHGGAARLSSTEVYEALAFMRALEAQKITLFYPGDPSRLPAVGLTERFSVATVGAESVRGVSIGVQGLAGPGGLAKFSTGVGAAMEAV